MNTRKNISLRTMESTGKGRITDPIGKIASAFHRYMQVYVSRSLVNGHYGIGPGQLYVLLAVAHNEGLCQKQIAKTLMIEKATIAKAVKTLALTGYVQTEADPRDKRHIKVYLSEKGRRIMPSIQLFLDEMNQLILTDFTPEEVDMVYAFLEKMNQNLLKKLINVGDKVNENQR